MTSIAPGCKSGASVLLFRLDRHDADRPVTVLNRRAVSRPASDQGDGFRRGKARRLADHEPIGVRIPLFREHDFECCAIAGAPVADDRNEVVG